MLLQWPRQWPLERQGPLSLSHPTSPHFAFPRPQHERSRLKPPEPAGSPSSKIAVSLSFSFSRVFSLALSSACPLLSTHGQCLLFQGCLWMERHLADDQWVVKSDWSYWCSSEAGAGWEFGASLLGCWWGHPLVDTGEAVEPGPRLFLTCAYRLPSSGPLVWQISDRKEKGVWENVWLNAQLTYTSGLVKG